MSVPDGVVLATGDATMKSYVRTFDTLTIELTLWNEKTQRIEATGVTRLEDDGTWEAEALIRLPALDGPGREGFAVIDVEDNPTLRFAATGLQIGDPT
ncbi:hypothetical protein [Actinoplanes sp. NPDC049265]|uniref:hypothetical protein n=1 Tax=Actinoplanes sp. NPDC049265 TaxID=3363902 RepID=UPI00371900DD